MHAPAPERANQAATWFGFAAMCAGMFMAILDIQVVATSLPTIRAALEVPPDAMSWVQTTYLIAEVISIPLTGWLTRVLTMRGLFSIAVSLFTAASLGCAVSQGFASLMAWRLFQGMAGGTLIPLVFSAVFLLFPVRAQGLATTIAGVLAVLAPTLGPIVGGWITETFSWHWLFLINVAPGVAAALVGFYLLPRENPDLRLARTLDWLALTCLALALGSLELGLKEAPERGWSSGATAALFALCLSSGAGFVSRTLGSRRPLVSLRTLRDGRFALGCALSFLTGIGLYGSVYLMPVFLAFVRQHGAFEIGRIMLVTGMAQLVTAPIAVQLERRIDPRLLSVIGFALFAVGLGLSAFETRETDFSEMLWPQIIRGSAIMLCLLAPTRLALGHLLPDAVPDASGLFNLMRNLGGAIGIALIDTVIWTRAPFHAGHLAERLLARDGRAAALVGIPQTALAGPAPRPDDPIVQAIVRPLIERASLVSATNEAWAMVAAFVAAGAMIAFASVVARGKNALTWSDEHASR